MYLRPENAVSIWLLEPDKSGIEFCFLGMM